MFRRFVTPRAFPWRAATASTPLARWYAASKAASPAAAAATPAPTTPTPIIPQTPTQRDLVKTIMSSEQYYCDSVLEEEMNTFFGQLKLPLLYHLTFSPQQIANHVHAMIAAKQMFKLAPAKALEFQVDGKDYALFVCSTEADSISRTEKLLGDFILHTNEDCSCSVFSFETSIMPGQSNVLYIATREKFLGTIGGGVSSGTDINLLASREFLWNRPPEVKARYQKLLREHSMFISPRATVEVNPDDTIVMLCVPASFPSADQLNRNYLQTVTSLAARFNIKFEKKFVESFSNGCSVYSFHSSKPVDKDVMKNFLLEAELAAFVPTSLETLNTAATPMNTYVLLYFSLVANFAKHFVAQSSEEFVALASATKGIHPRAYFHLRNMQKKLTQESVTFARVIETITNFPALALQIYEDFNLKVKQGKTVGLLNKDLVDRVRKTVDGSKNPVDFEILDSFLLFNSALLKTNFYKPQKSSICCELSGTFLSKTMYGKEGQDDYVHSVIMSVGVNFEGFTSMKRAISRGSINIILPNPLDHPRLLKELYFLTDQMMRINIGKNKDIPEGGTGTYVVVKPGSAAHRQEIALEYVNGLLDLFVEGQEEVFNTNKKEGMGFLFFGPGKNTDDLMDSITSLARKRGYAHANSIATGKSIGGIQHARERVASEGRRLFALGAYKKLGLEPQSVTKVMTGGPDCPEALDEIRLSQGKIVCIVDKHGVLVDSNGLCKNELINLGEKGFTIKDYNVGSSSTACRITREMKNFTCPFSKQTIENGDLYCTNFLGNLPFTADCLVLCEARTTPVNQSSYDLEGSFSQEGKPKISIVVEASNMAYTEDMRNELERKGVILYKDSSTNKGAMLASSREVLAALAFTNAEYEANMVWKSGAQRPPEFYTSFVADIKTDIRANGQAEFDLIEREITLNPQRTRTEISNLISKKIQRLERALLREISTVPVQRIDKILSMAIPPTLVQKLSLATIKNRVPKEYLDYVYAAHVACEYTYQMGLGMDDLAFHEFFQGLGK